jgi:putative FmdB family regulatory protein
VPTYEYECNDCSCRFERRQGFDEEPVAECPQCRGKARRVIHSIPVIFKGSGFYITDSRKGTSPDDGDGHGKAKEELAGKEKGK